MEACFAKWQSTAPCKRLSCAKLIARYDRNAFTRILSAMSPRPGDDNQSSVMASAESNSLHECAYECVWGACACAVGSISRFSPSPFLVKVKCFVREERERLGSYSIHMRTLQFTHITMHTLAADCVAFAKLWKCRLKGVRVLKTFCLMLSIFLLHSPPTLSPCPGHRSQQGLPPNRLDILR